MGGALLEVIFGELGRSFKSVENRVLRDRRQFDSGHDDRVAGAGLRMPRAHFSWQALYFVDFNKKSV